MTATLEHFVKQLEESGIIAPGKLSHFVPPKGNPQTVEELVRELVKQNHLTRYQAEQIAAGEVRCLILGGYTILDRIGAGGMGQVFKAEHRRMKRVVAIKTLPTKTMKDAVAVARFQREVEAAGKLRHPNIVAADDADEANGIHFLVMEYVEGSDLSALVKKHGPFSIAKATNYILQAARGLEFAHSEGVVHRDIKPANLLLDKKGGIKILDMGLARFDSEGDAETQAELTGTGTVLGSVDYMAPEQALSAKCADARADIYSLGCSLYYLLTGKPTYDGETVTAKLIAHQGQSIPELRMMCESVSEELEVVFKKMVSKKIEDRYQSMSEVIADLERCTSGQTTFVQQPDGTIPDNSALTFLKNIQGAPSLEESKTTKKIAAITSGGGKRQRFIPTLVGAALLGIAILAGIIVSLRTKEGTLVVEVNQRDAMVQVLDAEGKVEVSQKAGVDGKITIGVDPGKHRLKVEMDGFTVFGQEFEMASGGKKEIMAKLEAVTAVAVGPKTPLTTPQVDSNRRTAEWVLKKGGSVEVKGGGKQVEVNRLDDLPVGRFNLLHLTLPNIEITKEDLDAIKDVGSMNLCKVKLTEQTLNSISQLQRLDYVNLSGSSITDQDLKYLEPWSHLRYLLLRDANRITADGVANLQKVLPGCKIEWNGKKSAQPPSSK